MINLVASLLFTWFFYTLIPNSLARQEPANPAARKPPPSPPALPRKEHLRMAVVSTLVALTAVRIFFSFGWSSFTTALLYICFIIGEANINSSFQEMKARAIACLIGGIAIIVFYNLIRALPTYPFLVALTLCFSLLLTRKMYDGGPMAGAYGTAFITFCILLGTSTFEYYTASYKFYLRVGEILFAGWFAIAGIMLVDHLLRPGIIFKRVPVSKQRVD